MSSEDTTMEKSISWDSDSTTAVLDNSANTHIWNELSDFIEGTLRYFEDNEDVGVLTIDKSSVRPIGIGTVVVVIVIVVDGLFVVTRHSSKYGAVIEPLPAFYGGHRVPRLKMVVVQVRCAVTWSGFS